MQNRSRVVRGAVAVTAWLVATVLAGTVAWAAVSRLGRPAGAVQLRPLSPAEVSAQLAQPGPPATAGHSVSRPTGQTHALGTGQGVPRLGRPPRGVFRSWQVVGGAVGIACRGPAAHLLYAAPLDGWAYRLESWRRIISVEFTRSAQTSALRAHCVSGVPARLGGDGRETPGGDGGAPRD